MGITESVRALAREAPAVRLCAVTATRPADREADVEELGTGAPHKGVMAHPDPSARLWAQPDEGALVWVAFPKAAPPAIIGAASPLTLTAAASDTARLTAASALTAAIADPPEPGREPDPNNDGAGLFLTPGKALLRADKVEISGEVEINGGQNGGLVNAEAVAAAFKDIHDSLRKLSQTLNGWAPQPQDGGSALKMAISSGWAAPGFTPPTAQDLSDTQAAH